MNKGIHERFQYAIKKIKRLQNDHVMIMADSIDYDFQ